MEPTRTRWLETFSARLRSATHVERTSILYEAENALRKLRHADLRQELASAAAATADEQLLRWLHTRLEPPEVRRRQALHAFLTHLRGAELAQQGGEAMETGLQMIEDALTHVLRSESPDDWAQIQHHLAETFVQRIAGTRSDNLERAVAAYQAALPLRHGIQRIDTLLGLAQSLRQRLGGVPSENRHQGERALEEAGHLLAKNPDPNRQIRLMIEQSRWQEASGHFDAAWELLCSAKQRAPRGELDWHVREREATLLTTRALAEPQYRAEAIAANRALLDHPSLHNSPRRPWMLHSRLLQLGEVLAPPTSKSIAEEDLRTLLLALGDEALAPPLVSALELRVRSEERAAFRLPSGRALVRIEGDLSPLLMRLALELNRAGNDIMAVGYLAHLGAWSLRRALRWTDLSGGPENHALRWSRVLEDRLSEVMAWASTFDVLRTHGQSFPPPAPEAAERLQSYLTGAVDQVHLTPDDLTALLSMPASERDAAAAELRAGIEQGITGILTSIEQSDVALFNSLTSPTLLAPGHLTRALSAGQSFVVFMNEKQRCALGAVWKNSDDSVHSRLVFDTLPAEESSSEAPLPMQSQVKDLVRTLRADGVTRIGLVCRGVVTRLAAISFGALTQSEPRIVHLPGVDRPSLPPLDRSRSDRLLIFLDEDPDANLPCLVAVSKTLERAGFRILRPGASPTEASVAAMQTARVVLMVGHGEGVVGPMGPSVGPAPVSHFDQYPLAGCEWSACIACDVGDPAQQEAVFWDRDDPFGAAEALLLAGSRAAVDCLRPVPEVLAAMVLEEVALRSLDGVEPEIVFGDALRAHRVAWSQLAEPLAVCIRERGILETDELSSWLTTKLDAVRRKRLGHDVSPLPPLGIFQKLGARPPSSGGAPIEGTRSASWARRVAEQDLAPFTEGDVWGAFRWMGRK